ncbi:MAG: H-NS histone family protein [Georgfuchsia sp.]
MDISTLSIEELQALQTRIPDEIKSRKAQQKKNVLKEISDIAARHGYKLEELIGPSQDGADVNKSATRKPAKVKYRNPTEPGLQWTGRGKKPAWVTAWLNQGKSLDELKVD